MKGLPFDWLFEKLARRWGVTPYDLERRIGDPLVRTWVVRSMTYMELESVEVKKRG